MTTKKPVLPTSTLGKIAAVTLLVSVLILLTGIGTSFIERVEADDQAPNPVGMLAPLALLGTLVGSILAWIAIAKKDHARLLIAVAIIATLFFVLTFVFELIEVLTMSAGA